MTDALHIESPSGNIGGDNDIELAALELLDRSLALFLLNVSVQWCAGIAASFQFLGQLDSGSFGAHKNQHRVKSFRFQYARQGIQLVAPADRPVALPDRVSCGGFNFYGNQRRIIQVACGNAFYLRWHGG